MDSAPRQPTEAEADRERHAREADGIAQARTSVAAGYYATAAEVSAWIDSLGTDNPLPVPYPRHPRPRRPGTDGLLPAVNAGRTHLS